LRKPSKKLFKQSGEETTRTCQGGMGSANHAALMDPAIPVSAS
jgi:hypothetical protein